MSAKVKLIWKSTPALIAVDWGTTTCRAALLDADGVVLETLERGTGILAVTDLAFEGTLRSFLTPWRSMHPDTPVILSGMIGSRNGWQEATYVACPAGFDEIVANLAWVDRTTTFERVPIVPGLIDEASGTPDVMRGEETQIIGALGSGSGLCVLPGTHSKWATVENGHITGFRSYMTGEVFAALKDHTILGRLMTPLETPDEVAFLRGVRDGAKPGGPGRLLNRVFATRTLGLFEQLPDASLADYLSGVLIGAEIADNAGQSDITIIGSAALTRRYSTACQALGRVVTSAPTDCAARGAFAIARAARIV